MARDWSQDEAIKMLDQELTKRDAEIERLREEVSELKDLLQATVNYTGASVSSQKYTFHAALSQKGKRVMIITELKEQIAELKSHNEILLKENERMSEILRQIAFKMIRRKMLKDPPPASEFWSELFHTPKEFATWIEDIGELANSGLREKE